jgi:hypothetical protein
MLASIAALPEINAHLQYIEDLSRRAKGLPHLG